ncbi:DEAD/DEAH box helicase [Rhodococcus coprophilus]|uniref:DEAD/DEAH box helicase n=1 Tax=Rhodococcus coprophilus TaxID=38310 RepID=UPI003427AC1B
MSSEVRSLDAIGSFEFLREAFFRYYDSPFGLAEKQLEKERRGLLDQPGGIYQRPLIEGRPQYRSTGRSLEESVELAELDAETAVFLRAGGMPEQLYMHQEQALRAGTIPGRNVVITAGTGSGKTESFLLPVIAGLISESRNWGGAGVTSVRRWWARPEQGFETQRSGEQGRRAAVRAMIMYPMNALVDDQLVRLRRALDSDEARAWLDQNRDGHRFYFGRYTGATPVSGSRDNGLARSELAKFFAETAKISGAAAKLPDPEHRYFVPRIGGAEMLSRWDMADFPPDIMITNYSMLNVMLLRPSDAQFFEATREWLFEKESNRFTLVVDELHSYRGTAGTEVALLLRNLKHRLGIADRPDKIRVLAASASLDPERDKDYLEEFFGVDADDFEFLPGELLVPDSDSLDVYREPKTALTNAFRVRPDGTMQDAPQAKSEDELGELLFAALSAEERRQAVRDLLNRASSEQGWPLLRSHMFFRNVPGMWACTDPDCSELTPDRRFNGRTVGRLFAEPRSRCDCGSRVLELLYCQNCGDVLLGGFTAEGAPQKAQVKALLLADVPDLGRIPDQVSNERTVTNYMVYWPRTRKPEAGDADPQWEVEGVSFGYFPARFDPANGSLAVGKPVTGWGFRAKTSTGRRSGRRHALDLSRLAGLPTQCPNCGDDWEVKRTQKGVVPLSDPTRLRSPIRTMRTGFEKINQILVTELAQQLADDKRKLIVFTDSRQDAAKLSSGIALRHYQDLVRILLLEALGGPEDDDGNLVPLARAWVRDGVRNDQTTAARKALRERDRDTFERLTDIWSGDEEPEEGELEVLEARFSRPPTLNSLRFKVRDDLLRMGVNPGGPAPSRNFAPKGKNGSVRWSELYSWTSGVPKPRAQLDTAELALLANIDEEFRKQFLDGIYSGAGRDFESLGLGWIALELDTSPDEVESDSDAALARSSLRVLGDMRRFFGLRNPVDRAPRKLRDHWETLAKHSGLSVGDIEDRVRRYWSTAVVDFLIDDSKISVRKPIGVWWVCQVCRRPHLHRGTTLCTRCGRNLPETPESITLSEDYYAWKASEAIGRFRMNAAELTGQTDRIDAQSRQARFQGVFLNESENERPDGVDLLSVTTTMEAGVDIGSLEAVVLGNMPPSRFNYQQRVGRAGRRQSKVAIAMTVCRGRSHDEYYFDRPARITNDPTPRPYLALDQKAIFRRVLASETLRMAFAACGDALATEVQSYSGTGTNTHGQFGLASEWPLARTAIEAWLERKANTVREAANALAVHTGLESDVDEIVDGLLSELITSIDDAVSRPSGAEDLSQRLAESGVLPMFGFPTKVRNLYLRKPTSTYPWPPKNLIDRDAAMAVSQFAPGAELVRDGTVYPAAGVAAYKRVGKTVVPEENPLGVIRFIDICRSCSYLEESTSGEADPTASCPRCGAEPGSFGTVPMAEPIGYLTGYTRDFDGTFAWSSRSSAAKAHADLEKLDKTECQGVVAYSGPGDRYVINDRGGSLFRFQPVKPGQYWQGSYISLDAVSAGLVRDDISAGPVQTFALGSVQPTDLMFVGSANPVRSGEGLRLNLDGGNPQPSGVPDRSEGRRAAWYSLAFLLRTAAATFLDVQPTELTAGLYSGQVDDQPTLFAFVADTLENGAGFSTHLGRADVFPEFLSAVQTYIDELGEDGHAEECSSSCYRCLRDYGNMAFHAFLDWRLARDLLAVLENRSLAPDVELERRLIEKWSEAYNATPIVDLRSGVAAAVWEGSPAGKVGLIARHPLEAAESGEDGVMSARLAQAIAELESRLGGGAAVVVVDSFVLDRDPAAVVALTEMLAAE